MRCESILKENLNPLRLSFLNQKQDSKDYLKQQQQQQSHLKPNDNFLLNDYSQNSFDINSESITFTSNNSQLSNKAHNRYSKSSKNILIDLNEDNDVKMINPNYVPGESSEPLEDPSHEEDHQHHGHSHAQGQSHSHGHGHSHKHNTEAVINMKNDASGAHCHNAKKAQSRNKRVWYKLITVLILCIIFMIGEIIGGILAHSISIQTDAAHMAADITGFFFSIMAIYISEKSINHLISVHLTKKKFILFILRAHKKNVFWIL